MFFLSDLCISCVTLHISSVLLHSKALLRERVQFGVLKNVVCDPIPNSPVLLPFVSVASFSEQHKMVKCLIHVVLFQTILHIYGKYFLAGKYSTAYSIHWFFSGRNPPKFLGIFCPKTNSTNMVFLARMFGLWCTISKRGVLKMCKLFRYFLTCINGCKIRWKCRGLLRKLSAKSWLCGSKLWARILSTYVFN